MEEQKIIKLAGKEYHLCVVVIKYVKAKRKKNCFGLYFVLVSCLKEYFCLLPDDYLHWWSFSIRKKESLSWCLHSLFPSLLVRM